jgi:hypothetical protein
MAAPATTTTRTTAAPSASASRAVPVDLPAAPAEPAKRPSQPALYEERATQRAALASQETKLQAALADAVAGRDRAVARAAVDGSTEAREARDAAVGAVMRAQADLDAVTSALARLNAQAAANAEAARINRDVNQIKAADRLGQDLRARAAKADAALAAFVAEFAALTEGVEGLLQLCPPEHKDAVFGGGHGLSLDRLARSARNQLATVGIAPRLTFPDPKDATLETAVAYFTQPLADAAAAVQPAPIAWD